MLKQQLMLYWCWTSDGSEDWFVVATSQDEAERFFSDYEGFDRSEANAQLLSAIPEHLQGIAKIGYPTEELIETCGGIFMHRQTPRVVRIENADVSETFTEGYLEFMVSQGDLKPPKA
jgi:hypothetical protein